LLQKAGKRSILLRVKSGNTAQFIALPKGMTRSNATAQFNFGIEIQV
jgi:hypothetical protein